VALVEERLIQKDKDEYIQERLHKVRGSGLHEAEPILLLAQKVEQVERALRSVEETLDSVYNIFDAMLERMSSPSG
jgi:pyrroloquinoline quinone (PQQ) biosynthesis protein C